MKVEKDTTSTAIVDNTTTKVVKKKKNIQFSTTVPLELFKKIEELEEKGIDRSKLIIKFFTRCTLDEEYLKEQLFDDTYMSDFIKSQLTNNDYGNRQTNNPAIQD